LYRFTAGKVLYLSWNAVNHSDLYVAAVRFRIDRLAGFERQILREGRGEAHVRLASRIEAIDGIRAVATLSPHRGSAERGAAFGVCFRNLNCCIRRSLSLCRLGYSAS
jgi:hypothetical protein